MNEMYLGSIFLWPLSWVPDDLAFCNGQQLQVSQNQALFSLISNMYGGDGITTFALPDLRSRVPIGTTMNNLTQNNLTSVALAATGGSENALLVTHTHTVQYSNPAIQIQSALLVNNAQATLEVPTTGCSIAAPTASDGSDPPILTPTNGFNNQAPNTVIAGVNVQANLVGGGVNLGSAGYGSGNYANMQPFLGMNYVMCIQGIYPIRP